MNWAIVGLQIRYNDVDVTLGEADYIPLYFCVLFFHSVCNCDAEGTMRDVCHPNTGVYICMNNFAGPRCEVCNEGYFRFPACDGRIYELYFFYI